MTNESMKGPKLTKFNILTSSPGALSQLLVHYFENHTQDVCCFLYQLVPAPSVISLPTQTLHLVMMSLSVHTHKE